jgi:hypothetical protein
MAGAAAAAAALARQQILQGTAHVIVFGNVTVTFPSDKFCKKNVDDHFFTKVESISAGSNLPVGGVKIGGLRVSHQHVHGNTGVAYVWADANNLTIIASGQKANGTPKDSGGYDWTTK